MKLSSITAIRIAAALLLGIVSPLIWADEYCDWGWGWLTRACGGAVSAFKEGPFDLYLSGYAYHGRGTYTQEKIDSYQEKAWGGGLGRRYIDDRDNAHLVYAIGFQDSNYKPQYQIGYGWLARWALAENFRVGVGITAFIGFRSDYCSYMCPLPLILPLGAIEYRRVALIGAYVPKAPGQENNGDVLFLFGKIALD